MAIPTIPSQDLAKLVLGYLHEEQLITVYDEFLQASPYLDAHTNEYNRIFMKSLRSILNEYWGVKIYVEKCRPFSLRKKLSQCNGLLEVVKFLISHIDLKRIQNINVQDKIGIRSKHSISQHVSIQDRDCNACGASRFEGCNCSNQNITDQGHFETTPSNIVEATSLTDLPGSIKRKQVKVLERDSSEAERLMSCDPNDSTLSKSFNCPNEETINPPNDALDAPEHDEHALVTRLRSPIDANQNIQALEDISSATSNNYVAPSNECRPDNIANNRAPIALLHNFSAGVQAATSADTHVNMSIPDSSTSENSITLLPTSTRNNIKNASHTHQITLSSQTVTAPRKTQYLIQVSSNNMALIQSNSNTPQDSKIHDSKVTILSDVRVPNKLSRNILPKKPSVLQNVTSTPLMQMETILINGTPAYKPDLQGKRVFTEDEIMAMPTVILVTTAAPAKTVNTIKTSETQSSNLSVTSSTNLVPSLGPLSINIVPDSPKPPGEIKNMPSLNAPIETADTKLVATVDLKNTSVPKDSTLMSKTSTPQCLPILRKSSSTPRRNSHVRVLDFTTPRRILHEAIGENGENPVEIVLSQSPSTHDQPMSVESVEATSGAKTSLLAAACSATDDNSSKENVVCPPSSKKLNWDADLRALCTQPDVELVLKPKSVKKKKTLVTSQTSTDVDETKEKLKSKKRQSSKPKTPSSKPKTPSLKPKTPKLKQVKKTEIIKEPVNVPKPVEVPVKPTINIVTDWHATEPEKTENKSSGDSQNETPDMDRTSLQNVIGAKLNISDLLETPYKQALYDIQMETPRFLRPDIPISGEPLSEIKIMDIPTPRFFDNMTPGCSYASKPGKDATPSSYSSRPTDYSSGGSYYKPDEQDYSPHFDDLGYPVVNTENAGSKRNEIEDKSSDKPSRPVRQCTKNVSYTYSDNNRTAKDAIANELSNDTSFTSMDVSKGENNDITVAEKEKKPSKERRKSSKKRKSPVKKVTPKFMKIKPRRPTPEKLNRRKSNVSESSQPKKRTSSKEKTTGSTPPVVPAPTKSRRKSSTPRKLHTKVLVSPSPESSESIKETMKPSAQDSDNENPPLRWSDDGSQDGNSKPNLSPINEEEDISKIRDYIAKSLLDKSDTDKNEEPQESGSLRKDLLKRGFDIETARSIERDLLDIPPSAGKSTSTESINKETTFEKPISMVKRNFEVEILDKTESDSSMTVLQEEELNEIEFSSYESNEESNVNYFVSEHIESINKQQTESHKLKDNFTMELSLDEDFSIRLKTSALTFLIDNPDSQDESKSIKETEEAVNCIPNYDKLYTPLKHHRQAPLDTLIEVFDSSLTSIDTPLKSASPKNDGTTVTEIVLEVEQINEKEDGKGKSKKRRRVRSESGSDESQNESKRNRREILPNIQNFDIESVLSKLHGP